MTRTIKQTLMVIRALAVWLGAPIGAAETEKKPAGGSKDIMATGQEQSEGWRLCSFDTQDRHETLKAPERDGRHTREPGKAQA